VREVLYEESATLQNPKAGLTKYYIFLGISILFFVLFSFQVFLALFFVPVEDYQKGNIVLNIISVVLPALVFLATAILFLKFKNKFYIDYDYIFVTGSIRISKVIKNVKRKLVIKFETSNIEKLGKYGSETYLQYGKLPGIKKKILTLNVSAAEGKEFYYMVVNVDDQKQLLVFECTELFIVNVLKFSNKAILEKDFK